MYLYMQVMMMAFTSIRRFEKQLPSFGAGALVAEQANARQANPATAAARVRFCRVWCHCVGVFPPVSFLLKNGDAVCLKQFSGSLDFKAP